MSRDQQPAMPPSAPTSTEAVTAADENANGHANEVNPTEHRDDYECDVTECCTPVDRPPAHEV